LDVEVIYTIFCLCCMVKVSYGCSCSDFFIHSIDCSVKMQIFLRSLQRTSKELKFLKIFFFWFVKIFRQLGRKHRYTIAVMKRTTNSEVMVESSYKFTSFKAFFNYLVTQWISAIIFTYLRGSTNICSILKLLRPSVVYETQWWSLLQSMWVLQC
jgi:hypothetical protein